MTTVQFTWTSNGDAFDVVDYALKKAMFEREFLELKQPPGIIQLMDANRIPFMETNDFGLKIAKVNIGRRESAGSGNLQEFFQVWLKDPTGGRYPTSTFSRISPIPGKSPQEMSATIVEPNRKPDKHANRMTVFTSV